MQHGSLRHAETRKREKLRQYRLHITSHPGYLRSIRAATSRASERPPPGTGSRIPFTTTPDQLGAHDRTATPHRNERTAHPRAHAWQARSRQSGASALTALRQSQAHPDGPLRRSARKILSRSYTSSLRQPGCGERRDFHTTDAVRLGRLGRVPNVPPTGGRL